MQTLTQALADWKTYYAMIGSSAAALIGLQFVVLTLIPDVAPNASLREIDAYSTPTVVQLGMALFVSAELCAPWSLPAVLAGLLAAEAACGLVYAFVVARRMARAPSYSPVLEDRLFFIWFPAIANLAQFIAAFMLRAHLHAALFTIAASTLLLLLMGIRNAWDIVTFVVTDERLRSTSRRKR